MLILKMLVITGIIYTSSYLGILKSKTFENRVNDLRMVQSSLNMFKTKIEFTYEPIKDIFEEISQIVYQNQENIFKNTVLFMEGQDTSDSWYKSLEKTKNDFDLEDREVLKTMGKLLGKTDKDGQIREICLTENLLQNQISKAEYEKNKNVKLYKTLGTVLGMGIGIILM